MRPLEPDPVETGEGSAVPRLPARLGSKSSGSSEARRATGAPAGAERGSRGPASEGEKGSAGAKPPGSYLLSGLAGPELAMSDFTAAYPNSRKIHVDGPQAVRVPMREI